MTAGDAAAEYIGKSWAVVPLPPREKAPRISGWPTRVFTPADFAPDANIGVKTGLPSGGLSDVDLDHPLAVEFAREFLPLTGATFGHGKTPQSHSLYVCRSPGRTRRWATADGATIVELRSTGGQTMFPPSIHPSGEPVQWATQGELLVVEWADLERACEELAAAVRESLGEPPPAPTPTGPPAPSRQRLLDRAASYADAAKPSAEGGRDNQAFSVAGHLAAFRDGTDRLTEAEILNLLRRWNVRNTPPLPDAQLAEKVQSALKNGTPRADHPGHASIPGCAAGNGEPFIIIRPAFKPVRELLAAYPDMRRPIVHGLLRQGETMNIIASSKAGKSWLVIDLALAVVLGRLWLGRFQAEAGEVLILDNELHPNTTANRIPKVAQTRGIDPAEYVDKLFVDNLRGRLVNFNALPAYFDAIEPGRFAMIVLDALYRFWPSGADENDNGVVTQFYNILDAAASRLDSSFALIHHASKGNQANKSVVDIGAGAGAQSRAADTHLVLRPHKEDGAVVLEAGLRSWPPVDPFGLRWTFPTWDPDPDLNPRDLRQPPTRRNPKLDKPEVPEEPKPTYGVEDFARDFLTEKPQRDLVIIERARTKVGAERQAQRFLALAESQGLAHRWTFPRDRKVYFANCPQPALGLEAEA